MNFIGILLQALSDVEFGKMLQECYGPEDVPLG